MAFEPYQPPVSYLKECVEYDPETGLFTWRVRPVEHFSSEKAQRHWNRRFAGTPAFRNVTTNGYLSGRITYEGRYSRLGAHRAAWALTHGEYPSDQLDHVSRDRTDNRLANLRSASQTENNWNAASKPRENGLPRGVTKNGKYRFAAGIWNAKKYTYLGTFDTPEEASAAWQEAAQRTRKHFLEAV